MVSTGGTIFASDYNNIRTTVQSVLETQYGQTLTSSTVAGSSTTIVTASQLSNLYIDLQSAFVHQTGAVSTNIAIPNAGYTIGADIAYNYNTSTGQYSAVTDGTKMGINDYIAVATDVANFDPASTGFPPGNLLPGTVTTSTRTTNWGGAGQVQKVYHIVTVTFASVSAKNSYFNAGGEIRFTASLTSTSGSKGTDWAALLSAMGTVKFNKYGTTADSGTSGGIGVDGLTASYQQLLIKSGSGVYADNDYTLEGRNDSSTVLRFRITFDDGDTGTGGQGIDPGGDDDPIDETVSGTLASNAQPARPSSSFIVGGSPVTAVDVPAPVIASVATLNTDYVTPPT